MVTAFRSPLSAGWTGFSVSCSPAFSPVPGAGREAFVFPSPGSRARTWAAGSITTLGDFTFPAFFRYSWSIFWALVPLSSPYPLRSISDRYTVFTWLKSYSVSCQLVYSASAPEAPATVRNPASSTVRMPCSSFMVSHPFCFF